MRLQFRGKIYEGPHVELETTEGEVGGMYRGKPWKVHNLKEQYRNRHNHQAFTYRGVHYTKD